MSASLWRQTSVVQFCLKGAFYIFKHQVCNLYHCISFFYCLHMSYSAKLIQSPVTFNPLFTDSKFVRDVSPKAADKYWMNISHSLDTC